MGFYSLEMAADLELDPKPYHVIAFEEAGDCRNLCYIIQSKMEILGNGNAFIVARPPKVIYEFMMLHCFSQIIFYSWNGKKNSLPFTLMSMAMNQIYAGNFHP